MQQIAEVDVEEVSIEERQQKGTSHTLELSPKSNRKSARSALASRNIVEFYGKSPKWVKMKVVFAEGL